MKKIIFVSFFFLLFALAFATSIHAQSPNEIGQTKKNSNQIIRVSPVIQYLILDPGTLQTQDITIENLTDRALPVTLTFESFSTNDEIGGYNFDGTQSELSRWIKMNETDFILEPKETFTTTISFQIPDQVAVGGYYGMLFVNPILASNPEALQLAPKIGILLLANIGIPEDQKNKIEILEFQPETLVDFRNTSNYILRVKNNSLFHYTAKAKIELTPLFGDKTEQELEEKFIFPGKVRRWESSIALPNDLPNAYKTTLYLSTGNGEQISNEALIISFPFKYSAILILTVVLVWVFVRKHRQIRKAIKILILNK